MRNHFRPHLSIAAVLEATPKPVAEELLQVAERRLHDDPGRLEFLESVGPVPREVHELLPLCLRPPRELGVLGQIVERGGAVTPHDFEVRLAVVGGASQAHAPSLTQEHAYDSLGRLTAVERPAASNMATAQAWDFDGANNWATFQAAGLTATSQERLHDATHSIQSITEGSTTQTYGHDANDNRLRDGTYTYEWDAFNRLRVVNDASDGALIAEYDYDARDRRVTKNLSWGIESFVYDGEDVVAEYVDGALVREYVHGPGYDEPLALLEDSNGDGSTSGPGDRRFYFVSDALGSIVQLEDESGQAVQGYVYEAYGETRVLPASGDIDWTSLGGAPVVENPYGYTGQRLDPETGLYYYKARYYDPGDGRFLSRDPIGVWGDQGNHGNGYAYVGGAPTTGTDPTGQTMMQCPSLAHYCSYNANGDIAWVHEWQPAPVHDPCMSNMYWCMPGSEGDQHWAAYSDYVDDQIVETIAWAGCGSVGAVTMMEWESACSRNPCYGMNGWARLKCDLSQTASVATFAGGVGLAFKSTRTSFRAANYADDAASLGLGEKVVQAGGRNFQLTQHATEQMTRRGITDDAIRGALDQRPFHYVRDGTSYKGYFDPTTNTFVPTVDGRIPTVMQGSGVRRTVEGLGWQP